MACPWYAGASGDVFPTPAACPCEEPGLPPLRPRHRQGTGPCGLLGPDGAGAGSGQRPWGGVERALGVTWGGLGSHGAGRRACGSHWHQRVLGSTRSARVAGRVWSSAAQTPLAGHSWSVSASGWGQLWSPPSLRVLPHSGARVTSFPHAGPHPWIQAWHIPPLPPTTWRTPRTRELGRCAASGPWPPHRLTCRVGRLGEQCRRPGAPGPIQGGSIWFGAHLDAVGLPRAQREDAGCPAHQHLLQCRIMVTGAGGTCPCRSPGVAPAPRLGLLPAAQTRPTLAPAPAPAPHRPEGLSAPRTQHHLAAWLPGARGAELDLVDEEGGVLGYGGLPAHPQLPRSPGPNGCDVRWQGDEPWEANAAAAGPGAAWGSWAGPWPHAAPTAMDSC